MAHFKRLIFYLNKDNLDLKKIAKVTCGKLRAGCVVLEDVVLYQSGKTIVIAESAVDAFNKVIATLSQISVSEGKPLKIIALGLIDRNDIARVFCPFPSLILEIIRREALEILDLFGISASLRDAIANLIAEEIFNDIIFSNRVVESEMIAGPSGAPLLSGWLVIDNELMGKLVASYRKKVLKGTISPVLRENSLVRRLKKFVSEYKKDFVIAIISGFITEIIIRVITTTLGAAPSLGVVRTDSTEIGRILKTKQKMTSLELAKFMKIPESIAILRLNSVVAGRAAKISNYEIREYAFMSNNFLIARGLFVYGHYDTPVSSKVFRYHLQNETITYEGRLKYIMKDKVFTRPRELKKILKALEKNNLLADMKTVYLLIKKFVPD